MSECKKKRELRVVECVGVCVCMCVVRVWCVSACMCRRVVLVTSTIIEYVEEIGVTVIGCVQQLTWGAHNNLICVEFRK